METKTNPLISVIVPIYNAEQYLDECVQSIIHQTYSNLEIILVDDGSPDRCAEMCDEYAKQDARINVIHKKNGGQSSARNAGLEISTGKYIGFVDSDDYISPLMYEKLYQQIEKDDSIGISRCQVLRFNGSEKCVFGSFLNSSDIINPGSYFYSIMTEKIDTIVCNKLFNAELIKHCQFQQGKCNEDFLFLFELTELIETKRIKVSQIEDFCYFYRENQSGICLGRQRPLYIDSILNLEECYGWSENRRRGDSYLIKLRIAQQLIMLLASAIRGDEKSQKFYDEYRSKIDSIDLNLLFKHWGIRHIFEFFFVKYFPSALKIDCIWELCTKRSIMPPVTKL